VKRVSIRDIARKAKVHFTLVAVALRDDPRVRAATKERILKMANRLGYQRDAKLAELMVQVKTTAVSVTRKKLAFVSTNPSDLASYGSQRLFSGVQDRAAFWVMMWKPSLSKN
jgi:LacI family transcriptional regulator